MPTMTKVMPELFKAMEYEKGKKFDTSHIMNPIYISISEKQFSLPFLSSLEILEYFQPAIIITSKEMIMIICDSSFK